MRFYPPFVVIFIVFISDRSVDAARGWIWTDVRHWFISADLLEEKKLTCWTCPNKTDNEACNDWAPDKHCPSGYSVCMTVYYLDDTSGQPLSIIKSCTPPSGCHADHVGCRINADGIRKCTSCCNEDYCNEAAPFDNQSARDLSLSVLTSSSSKFHPAALVQPLLSFVALSFGNHISQDFKVIRS